MILYQVNLAKPSDKSSEQVNEILASLWKQIEYLVEAQVLTPVEPCEHGNYMRHMVDRWYRHDTGYDQWCNGKPEEEQNESNG